MIFLLKNSPNVQNTNGENHWEEFCIKSKIVCFITDKIYVAYWLHGSESCLSINSLLRHSSASTKPCDTQKS